MPLQQIKLTPGVNVEITSTQGAAQIISSQLVRFKPAGDRVLVEKMGGWQKFYPSTLGSYCRCLHAWEGINNDTYLGAGCESSLNVINGAGTIGTDITPRTYTSDPTVDFSTVSGTATVTIVDAGISTIVYDSIFIATPVAIGGIVLYGSYQIASVVSSTTYTITAASNATSTVSNAGAVPSYATTNGQSIVTVTLTAHGYSVGQTYAANVSTTVGGLTIYGNYIVQTVPSANTFTIVASTQATSTTSGSENAGKARILYFVVIAPPPPYAGYGTGTYGTGGYGTGSAPSPSPGTAITATNWTMDNWGEILLSCPTGGAVYAWSPDSGFSNAAKVVNAPLINGGIFIAQPAQILVCWGASYSLIGDPLQIKWSDAGDYTNFTVSSQTQAGGFRIPTGSKIVGGINGPNFNIIWTDLDVWSMDYVEPPLVFGFNAVATNCGLIGRHAMGIFNASVFWMGAGNFYRMDGENVQIIPCSVWDVVFQDLDTAHADKIVCATNTLFGEVMWYYPSESGGTGEVDKYVKYNVILGCWDFGALSRTAWTDQSVVGNPIGAYGNTCQLYQHEMGQNDDGNPMDTYIQTGAFPIADGQQLNFVDWMFPDFHWGEYGGSSNAVMNISFKIGDYPSSTTKEVGPYSVTSATQYVNTRMRARYVALRIDCNALDAFWRLGGLTVRSAPDGTLS